MKTKLAILLLPLLVAACAPKEDFSAGWSFWSDTAPEPKTVTLPHDAENHILPKGCRWVFNEV
jgi:hypothetical protein